MYLTPTARRILTALNANPSATAGQVAKWADCSQSTAEKWVPRLRPRGSASAAVPAVAPTVAFRAVVVPVALLDHETVQDRREPEVPPAWVAKVHPEVAAHELLAEALAVANTEAAQAAAAAAQATVDAYGALREAVAAAVKAEGLSAPANRAARDASVAARQLVEALGSGASSEKLAAWTSSPGDAVYGASLAARPDATDLLRRLRPAADAHHRAKLAAQDAEDKAQATFRLARENYTTALAAALAAGPDTPWVTADTLALLGGWRPEPRTPAEAALRNLPVMLDPYTGSPASSGQAKGYAELLADL